MNVRVLKVMKKFNHNRTSDLLHALWRQVFGCLRQGERVPRDCHRVWNVECLDKVSQVGGRVDLLRGAGQALVATNRLATLKTSLLLHRDPHCIVAFQSYLNRHYFGALYHRLGDNGAYVVVHVV